MTADAKVAPVSPAAMFRLAAALGLAAGMVELLLWGIMRFVLGRFLFVGRDVLWMTPLAELLLFLLAGSILVLVARVAPRWMTLRTVATVLLTLSAFAVALMYPPLDKRAGIVIALGVGVQGGRWVAGHADLALRLAGRIALGFGVLALLMGGGEHLHRLWAERRGLAALPSAAEHAPNVLLLILDTVRAQDLSLYGFERPTTPALSRLAARGIRFDRAIAPAPWTLPSHASFFTGEWPHSLSADWLAPLDTRFPTLAEKLQARGYSTAGFVGNLLYTDTEKGLARGFLHYEDFTISLGELSRASALIREFSDNRPLRELFHSYDLFGRKSARVIDRDFLSWLDHREPRPFFAFLNFFDAHAPYLPSPEFRDRFATPGPPLPYRPWVRYRGRPKVDSLPADYVRDNLDRYHASLAELDDEIGRLFAELERRGVLDRTIVILASDHGEQFGEHALMGHGNSLYRPLLHVPLVVWLPGAAGAGSVVPDAVSLRDLPHTVLELAGDPAGGGFPGKSLARFWDPARRAEVTGRDTLLMELSFNDKLPKGTPIDRGPMRAVLLDTLHYIRNGDGVEELYDFERDLAQAIDLARTPAGAADLPDFRAILTERGAMPPLSHRTSP